MSLACKNLTLQIGSRVLCRDLALSVRPGEVWGVLGPNGAGKTTLLDSLAGLGGTAQGRVTVDGDDVRELRPVQRAQRIGLLPQQESSEFWGSALDYVLLGRFPHARAWLAWARDDEQAARAQLDAVGLAALAGRRYATLSGGERQRVRLAQLLVQAPRYMLLDEPLQHLDLRHQMDLLERVTQLARAQARGVVMVLHDVLWPARCCTHALLLDGGGRAQAGAACDVLTRANLEALFGCALLPAGAKGGAGFVPAL